MEDNIKRLVQLTGLFYFTVKVYFFGGNSVDTVPFKAKGILKYSANIECNTVDVSFEDPGVKATAVMFRKSSEELIQCHQKPMQN